MTNKDKDWDKNEDIDSTLSEKIQILKKQATNNQLYQRARDIVECVGEPTQIEDFKGYTSKDGQFRIYFSELGNNGVLIYYNGEKVFTGFDPSKAMDPYRPPSRAIDSDGVTSYRPGEWEEEFIQLSEEVAHEHTVDELKAKAEDFGLDTLVEGLEE